MVAFGVIATTNWANADTPLPEHPDMVSGKLDNGLRYILKKHSRPPGRVGIFLRIEAGSLNETESQRGVAHFLEHMAFNGSENFAPGELIPFFESLGLQFGKHQNASTGFDRTMYTLDLTKNDPETVEAGLLFLSDVAFRLLLLEEEIDNERGVILEEKRTGLGADMRMFKQMFAHLLPGARLTNRLPIGTEEVITNAPRQEFVDFYETWYRPDEMTLMLVGDIEPDVVLPMVQKMFSDPAKRERVEMPDGGIQFYTDQKAVVITDPEETGGTAGIIYISEPGDGTDTVEELRIETIEGLISSAMSRRLAKLVTEGAVPFRSADAGIMPLFGEMTLTQSEAECEPELWDESMTALLIELKRAYKYGFTEQELEDVKAEMLSMLNMFAAQEDTIPSQYILQMIAQFVGNGDAIMSAKQRLEYTEKILSKLTAKDLHKAFRSKFDPSRFAFLVTLPEAEDVIVPTPEEILAVARTAYETPILAYESEERPDALLATLPKPGHVESREVAEDLGVTNLWLTNGVLVHHKLNDFTEEQVTITINITGGEIFEDEATRGITELVVAGWNQTATGEMSSNIISDMMTGKNISVTASNDVDSITLTVSGEAKDLEAGLQLAYLMLSDPIIEPSAIKNWKESELELIEANTHDPIAQVRAAIRELLTEDARRQMLTTMNIEHLTIEEASLYLQSVIDLGSIEVAVVGDVTLEDVEPLVLQYLGSLATRPRTDSNLAEARALILKEGPYNDFVEYDSIEPVAFALAGFTNVNASDIDKARLMELASQILSTRMNKVIREEKRLVYSIFVFSSPASIYKDAGIFAAGSMCDPENTAELNKVILEMMTEFAKEGPTDDEIDVSVGQIVSQLKSDIEEPAYWIGNLAKMHTRDRSFDEMRTDLSFYENVTADMVRETFTTQFTDDRTLSIQILPATQAEETEANTDK